MAPMLKELSEVLDEKLFAEQQDLRAPRIREIERTDLLKMISEFLVELGKVAGQVSEEKRVIEKFRNGEWRKDSAQDKHLLEIIQIPNDPDSCEDHMDSYAALIAEGNLDEYAKVRQTDSFDILDLLEQQKETDLNNGVGIFVTGTFPKAMQECFAERFHVLAIKLTGYDLDGQNEEIAKGWKAIESIQNGRATEVLRDPND